ncbi:hypothetical protein STEG23_035810, partial [Scotinomys teguina]
MELRRWRRQRPVSLLESSRSLSLHRCIETSGKLRQEDRYKFEASLGFMARTYLGKPNQTKVTTTKPNKQYSTENGL